MAPPASPPPASTPERVDLRCSLIVRQGETVFCKAVASDPDGDPLVYRWGDDLDEGYRTQVQQLAVSDDPAARGSRKYFHDLRPRQPDPSANDTGRQEKLLEVCRRLCEVALDALLTAAVNGERAAEAARRDAPSPGGARARGPAPFAPPRSLGAAGAPHRARRGLGRRSAARR